MLKKRNIEIGYDNDKGRTTLVVKNTEWNEEEELDYCDPVDVMSLIVDNSSVQNNNDDFDSLNEKLEELDQLDMDMTDLVYAPHYGRDNVDVDLSKLSNEDIDKIHAALEDLDKMQIHDKTVKDRAYSGKKVAAGLLSMMGLMGIFTAGSILLDRLSDK